MPAGPINSAGDIVQSEQFRARGMIETVSVPGDCQWVHVRSPDGSCSSSLRDTLPYDANKQCMNINLLMGRGKRSVPGAVAQDMTTSWTCQQSFQY